MNKEPQPTEQNQKRALAEADSSDQDLVTVTDRKGRKRIMAREEYESRKRSKRRRENRPLISFRNVISVAVILAIMIIAAYFAMQIVSQ